MTSLPPGGRVRGMRPVLSTGCYLANISYVPLDLPGHSRTMEHSAYACRRRCEAVEACAYFTWGHDGVCRLSDARALPAVANATTAGPRRCGMIAWPRVRRGLRRQITAVPQCVVCTRCAAIGRVLPQGTCKEHMACFFGHYPVPLP